MFQPVVNYAPPVWVANPAAFHAVHLATLSQPAALPVPTLFDRHIARRLIGGYVGFVLALIVFFVVLHYLEYVDDFMDRDASMAQVLGVYYPSYVPEIVRLTSPLALFLSGLYLTTKLSAELQLTALYAAGVSLGRIMRPFVLVGLLVGLAQFAMGGWLVPPHAADRRRVRGRVSAATGTRSPTCPTCTARTPTAPISPSAFTPPATVRPSARRSTATTTPA